MTNGHNPAARLVNPAGAPLIQDIKTQRVKMVIITQTFLASVLIMDGTTTLRCSGLPEGAECVGMTPPLKHPSGALGIGLLFYHPSFPVTIPGREPPHIIVNIEEFALELAEGDPLEQDGLPSPEPPEEA